MWWFRKLRNKLFGTEYYLFDFGFSNVIRPAIVCPDGTRIIAYFGFHIVGDGKRVYKRIL